MKKFLMSLYYFGRNSKSKIDKLQLNIRNTEWEAVSEFIPQKSKFLDVGCGAGYSMKLAQSTKECKTIGIDPEPFKFGFGRNWDNDNEVQSDLNIQEGTGENIPFENNSFDIVYSSHVLEHVNDEQKVLSELNRVVKNDGTVIIGVPTATMATISLISQLLFETHHRLFNFIFSNLGFKSFPRTSLKHLLFLYSHSFNSKTILYDLKHYRVKNWKKNISQELKIKKVLHPALYPYPDFIQLFKMKKTNSYSSSVFFICEKK